MIRRLPYPLVCAALGAALAWLPLLFHGPIPQKFSAHYLDGSIAVWAYYGARLQIGVLVGLVAWPRRWYLRGPLCGFFAMLPVTFIALAMPGCGFG